MSRPKKTGNYTNQGALNSPLRNSLTVNDFLLPSTIMAFSV
jgi:hypothetical protein